MDNATTLSLKDFYTKVLIKFINKINSKHIGQKMNFNALDTHLLSKSGATYDYPFDEKVRVYRVMDKIFALTTEDLPLEVNLKCDPIYSLELRSLYKSIRAGYHMNKKHWNTITADGDVDDTLFIELMDHSYDLIVSRLPKKKRKLLS